MIVKDKLWEDLRQAKANIICIQRYTDRGRKYSRAFNASIILIASIGTISGLFVDETIALWASAAVALSSILKTLLPSLIQSEQELSELDRLADYYSKFLNATEKIWYEFFHKFITEEEAMKRFFGLKEDECDKASTLNRLVRSISKKEQEKINERAGEYVNRVYFGRSQQSNNNNQKK
jgi:hypothetical protein